MRLIKNFDALATDRHRKIVLEAVDHVFKETDPAKLMSAFVAISPETGDLEVKTTKGTRTINLSKFKRKILLGAGSAVMGMAEGLSKTIVFDKGILLVPKGSSVKQIKNVSVFEGDHPASTLTNVHNSQKLLDMALNAEEHDLVCCLFSGGASSLLFFPQTGIDIADYELLIEGLTNGGAETREINTVRKHLSRVKGGLLARELSPATVLTFLLSNVVGDYADVIGSGPTVPDSSTFHEALESLRYHKLEGKHPAISEILRKGSVGEIPETPKENDPCFKNTFVSLVGDNTKMLEALNAYFSQKKIPVMEYVIAGGVENVSKRLSEIMMQGHSVVAGGETVAHVRKKHTENRNHELALRMLSQLESADIGFVFVALESEGFDGACKYSGAICDENTLKLAKQKRLLHLDYLGKKDSHAFFEKLGLQVETGFTGTNVGDLAIGILKGKTVQAKKEQD